jgi:hypothetical protein
VAAIISRSKLVRCSRPLVLEELAFGLHLLEPLGQLVADRLHRLLHGRAGRHIVAVGVDLHMIEAGRLLAGQRIEFDDLLDLVAEEGTRQAVSS